jgi:hypothetical protein
VSESVTIDEEVLRDKLVEIWREVLLLGAPGPDVDFVEVDGSSLTAVRIIVKVCEVIGRDLEVGLLFDFSTPRSLAAALASGTY